MANVGMSAAMRLQRRVLVCALLAPLTAPAQNEPPVVRRVGVLTPSTRTKEDATLAPFYDEMRALGWVEGRNIAYDRSYGEDDGDALGRLATELAARAPEVIYAPPQTAAVAAHKATRTIPIVFATGSDPVGVGLVASLSHPGGNATGVVTIADSLAPKRLQLILEALPATKRVGYLGDGRDARSNFDLAAIRAVAPRLGIRIAVAEASDSDRMDAAVARLLTQNVEVILTGSTLAGNRGARLVALTSPSRVPIVSSRVQAVEEGALFAYSGVLDDQLRRSAHLVDKVLKGARPADIPVEQSNRFELVVNRRTAAALGITLPPAFLLRADRVID
jgi:putative ABC transport system substrate-binding protein